jgi:hypothetical protein
VSFGHVARQCPNISWRSKRRNAMRPNPLN